MPNSRPGAAEAGAGNGNAAPPTDDTGRARAALTPLAYHCLRGATAVLAATALVVATTQYPGAVSPAFAIPAGLVWAIMSSDTQN